jgi:hypothetical protein
MPITHISPAWAYSQTDRRDVTRRIAQYKRRLVAAAKERGVWECFGQKEVRALTDEFGLIHSDPVVRQLMSDFYDWCGNYVPER